MSAYNGKVTIWIGKEDRAKWDAIDNKPEWLHEHLGIDIVVNRLNGQRIFKVNEKPPMYPNSQLYIDGVPKGGATYPEPTLTPPEEGL